MPDSLDIVLERYEQDNKARLDHASMLNKNADSLVNGWPHQMKSLIDVTIAKTRHFGLIIREFEQKLSPNNKVLGSSLAVWGEYPNALIGQRNPAKLTFKLTQTGAVRALIVGTPAPSGFEEREIEMDDAMPTEWLKDVLADYVGYCLRIGWE
jgi:hypothetical protein